MAVATPSLAYVSTIQAGIGIGQSSAFTFTANITSAWQLVCPVLVRFPASVSAGPEISVYRSTDGGRSYDTVALFPMALSRQSGGYAQTSLRLETGMYAVQVLAGGGSSATWTIQVLTGQIITGILNA